MRSYRIILLLIIMPLLGACGLTKPAKVSAMTTYAITPLHPRVANPRPRTQYSILVTEPTASPGYNTANMVYVNLPYKLRRFANNKWIAPPAQMLMPLFAAQLRQLGYFRAVVTAPFAGSSNYRLDTNLLELQQEFLTPNSKVRMIVQATLISNKSNKVIASRRFQAVVRAKVNDPYAGVIATNKAAGTISRQVARFVRRYLSLG